MTALTEYVFSKRHYPYDSLRERILAYIRMVWTTAADPSKANALPLIGATWREMRAKDNGTYLSRYGLLL
jgi:hypothetical protein